MIAKVWYEVLASGDIGIWVATENPKIIPDIEACFTFADLVYEGPGYDHEAMLLAWYRLASQYFGSIELHKIDMPADQKASITGCMQTTFDYRRAEGARSCWGVGLAIPNPRIDYSHVGCCP